MDEVRKTVGKYITAHAIVAAVAVGGAIVAMAPQVIIVPVLGLLGFTGNGVAASSIAATVHASIGNVAPGSLFATLQSAGAAGAGSGAVTAATQIAGSAVAAAAVGGRFLLSKALKAKL
ncbi:hypothetical protein C8A00DRAFT_36368 [Chaetomidium leptoderma]|uniref:Uncharacterized protein n=1 Tax=Chaetomidium leptoderma TaxID=669021 RepID=A0AAN6VIX5_9PEZI|nr:hypothetical protein C8A00DRAFT_36368 [Chaetomidium leptoderma]